VTHEDAEDRWDSYHSPQQSRGKISGEFPVSPGADPRMPLEELLRLALRQGRGYRP
jgi:hypothetical protein